MKSWTNLNLDPTWIHPYMVKVGSKDKRQIDSYKKSFRSLLKKKSFLSLLRFKRLEFINHHSPALPLGGSPLIQNRQTFVKCRALPSHIIYDSIHDWVQKDTLAGIISIATIHLSIDQSIWKFTWTVTEFLFDSYIT